MIFVGDDWSEAHHDVYVCDPDGRQLARQRLVEGLDGIARLHALLAAVAGYFGFARKWTDADDTGRSDVHTGHATR